MRIAVVAVVACQFLAAPLAAQPTSNLAESRRVQDATSGCLVAYEDSSGYSHILEQGQIIPPGVPLSYAGTAGDAETCGKEAKVVLQGRGGQTVLWPLYKPVPSGYRVARKFPSIARSEPSSAIASPQINYEIIFPASEWDLLFMQNEGAPLDGRIYVQKMGRLKPNGDVEIWNAVTVDATGGITRLRYEFHCTEGTIQYRQTNVVTSGGGTPMIASMVADQTWKNVNLANPEAQFWVRAFKACPAMQTAKIAP